MEQFGLTSRENGTDAQQEILKQLAALTQLVQQQHTHIERQLEQHANRLDGLSAPARLPAPGITAEGGAGALDSNHVVSSSSSSSAAVAESGAAAEAFGLSDALSKTEPTFQKKAAARNYRGSYQPNKIAVPAGDMHLCADTVDTLRRISHGHNSDAEDGDESAHGGGGGASRHSRGHAHHMSSPRATGLHGTRKGMGTTMSRCTKGLGFGKSRRTSNTSVQKLDQRHQDNDLTDKVHNLQNQALRNEYRAKNRSQWTSKMADRAVGCFESFSKVVDRTPIAHPQGAFKKGWNTLLLLLSLYIAILMPMQVAWPYDAAQPAVFWQVVSVMVDIVFLLDVFVVELRTAFVKDGMLVRDSALVIARYMSGRFLGDLAVGFPYAWFASPGFYSPTDEVGIQLLQLMRVLRPTLRLMRGESAQESPTLFSRLTLFGGGGGRPRASGQSRLLRLISLLCCACHWTGCVWWIVSMHERREGLTGQAWHPDDDVASAASFGLQFAHSFLWGASICTGFVMFDVLPSTLPQVLVTIFGLFIGLFISVVMTSSTTAALHAMDAKRALAGEKLERLVTYLNVKHVPEELTARIVEFFQYQMTSTKSVLSLQELEALPYKLQMMLHIQLHKGLITNCAVFRPLPEQAVISLLRRLKPEVFPPDSLLIEEGAPNRFLFLVSRGVLSVWKAFRQVHLREHVATLNKNDFFGEQSLIARDQLATATVQTVSFCDMLILSGTDFDEVLRDYMSMPKCKQMEGIAKTTRRRPPVSTSEKAGGSGGGGGGGASPSSNTAVVAAGGGGGGGDGGGGVILPGVSTVNIDTQSV